jgi:hypothetical protein
MKTAFGLALLASVALALGWGLLPERSASADAAADALRDAQARGKALWSQTWASGGKACSACHGGGKNKLTGARLKSFPKWDKGVGKVATGQEKLNEMIVKKCGGTALDLGHADLTALEAYVATLN